MPGNQGRLPHNRFLKVMRREADADRCVFLATGYRGSGVLVGRLSDDRPWEVLDRFSATTMHLLQHVMGAYVLLDGPTVDLTEKVGRVVRQSCPRGQDEYAGTLRRGDDFTACRLIELTDVYRQQGVSP